MPRHRRVVLLGCPHHVMQRGNNRRDVLFSDEDRQVYLALLREYSLKYELGIIGFCLMTNHIHLIAVPQGQTSLAKALGRTHSDYARTLTAIRESW
jgi:putative transposase